MWEVSSQHCIVHSEQGARSEELKKLVKLLCVDISIADLCVLYSMLTPYLYVCCLHRFVLCVSAFMSVCLSVCLYFCQLV